MLAKELVITVAIALAIYLPVREFVAEIRWAATNRLEPQIFLRDRLLIEKISKHFGGFKSGDILLVRDYQVCRLKLYEELEPGEDVIGKVVIVMRLLP